MTTTSLRFWTACAIAAMMLVQTAVAHMALLYPMPRGGVRDTKQFDGKVHAFIGFDHDRSLPCNGYNKPGPVTNLKAGQTINVRFWGPALPTKYLDTLPPKPSGGNQINQARHGGGFCEMSLSYDGGKTFHLIGKYSRSCPDFYYDWPVKIPDNAPSCNTPGKCLFVWSWTAVNVPQFYINCADIRIQGRAQGGSLPSTGIQIVDAPGYKKGVTEPGDGAGDKMGKGPISSEVKDNLSGKFANAK